MADKRYGRIVLDRGAASVVAVCTDCVIWRVMRDDSLTALRAAAQHEAGAHPETRRARDALRRWERRHGNP